METGKANLPQRKFSNNLCSYSVLSEVEHGLLLFKCELHIVTFFQSIQYRKSGEMSNITVEEPDKQCLCQVVKANIIGDKSSW